MSENKRTKAEIDAEYMNVAVIVGHKCRVLAQIEVEAEKVQKEIDDHLEKLLELNREGLTLPPEAPKEAELKAVETPNA